jgi:hypothetical protein
LDSKESSENTIIAPTELRANVDVTTWFFGTLFTDRLAERLPDVSYHSAVSFVQSDQHQRKMEPVDWHHENDRAAEYDTATQGLRQEFQKLEMQLPLSIEPLIHAIERGWIRRRAHLRQPDGNNGLAHNPEKKKLVRGIQPGFLH